MRNNQWGNQTAEQRMETFERDYSKKAVLCAMLRACLQMTRLQTPTQSDQAWADHVVSLCTSQLT